VERLAAKAQHGPLLWRELTDGLALHEIWSQFKNEAQWSYGLYSRDIDWASIEAETGWKRRWKILRAFAWAMLKKLSPGRRIALIVAIVLAVRGWASPPFEPLSLVGTAALLLLLALELGDRVTMKRDLEIARDIQRWLVPAMSPSISGVDIAFATRPANTVSGDYYDAFVRAPGRLMLAVADVAGKSVPAALLMATIQASLRTLAAGPASLPELVQSLNRYACAHSLHGARFTTAFLAELDLETFALTYICAGHNAPVLRRRSGEIERLEAGGLPLGIKPDQHYDCGEALLGRGDLLAIITDGVVEAENEFGVEYSDGRLLEELKRPPQPSAAEQLRVLMSSVDAFVGGTRQHDDITCLVLLRT
jgi:serine phosphatase RsbU (regulator of sigma subunit)